MPIWVDHRKVSVMSVVISMAAAAAADDTQQSIVFNRTESLVHLFDRVDDARRPAAVQPMPEIVRNATATQLRVRRLRLDALIEGSSSWTILINNRPWINAYTNPWPIDVRVQRRNGKAGVLLTWIGQGVATPREFEGGRWLSPGQHVVWHIR